MRSLWVLSVEADEAEAEGEEEEGGFRSPVHEMRISEWRGGFFFWYLLN